MSKQIFILFEVDDDMSPDDLHECLCKAIHEGDTDCFERLYNTVSDIKGHDELDQLTDTSVLDEMIELCTKALQGE